MIRLISQAITRSTVQRSVISIPISFSAASARQTLFAIGRQVVGAVGERDDLVVVPVLAQLLEAGVQVADVRHHPDHGLAVQLHHQPEHPVGRRVLRADVDQHVLGAEIVLRGLVGRQLDAQRVGGRVALGIETGRGQGHVDGAGAHRTPPRSPLGQPLLHVRGQLIVGLGDGQLLQRVVRLGVGGERLPGLLRPAEVTPEREVLPRADSPSA